MYWGPLKKIFIRALCNIKKGASYEMGKIILTTLGLPIEEKYLAPRPQKTIDLIKKIYSY